MTNITSNNPSQKKCEYCGSIKTGITMNNEGTKYQKWTSNPYSKGTWIRGKCYRNYVYLNARPLFSPRKSKFRKERR